jgi:hypothetical protein
MRRRSSFRGIALSYRSVGYSGCFTTWPHKSQYRPAATTVPPIRARVYLAELHPSRLPLITLRECVCHSAVIKRRPFAPRSRRRRGQRSDCGSPFRIVKLPLDRFFDSASAIGGGMT